MKTEEKIMLLNVLKRMKTKCDVLRLDFKKTGNQRKNDMDTLLSQIEVIERKLAAA